MDQFQVSQKSYLHTISEKMKFSKSFVLYILCFIHVIDMWTFFNFQPEPSPTTGSLFKPRPVHVSSSSSYTGRAFHQNTFTEHKSSEFEFRPPASNMVFAHLSAVFKCLLWYVLFRDWIRSKLQIPADICLDKNLISTSWKFLSSLYTVVMVELSKYLYWFQGVCRAWQA